MTITLENSGMIVTLRDDNSAFIVLSEPVACNCKRTVAFVINRGGRTLCIECDYNDKEATRASPDNS